MDLLFREDAYCQACNADIVWTGHRQVRLDRTVFYPESGGQPGDTGVLRYEDGTEFPIVDTRLDRDSGDVIHLVAEGEPLPEKGKSVVATIDWERRYRHMRMHTTLHVICGLIDAEITGAAVGTDKSRIDFNWPNPEFTKDELTAKLAQIVLDDREITSRWISDAELDAHPELVRTMSVSPPRGKGYVRLLEIDGIDLQPCGGTHVRRTGELGNIVVSKIENKGKHNRRVNVRFMD